MPERDPYQVDYWDGADYVDSPESLISKCEEIGGEATAVKPLNRSTAKSVVCRANSDVGEQEIRFREDGSVMTRTKNLNRNIISLSEMDDPVSVTTSEGGPKRTYLRILGDGEYDKIQLATEK